MLKGEPLRNASVLDELFERAVRTRKYLGIKMYFAMIIYLKSYLTERNKYDILAKLSPQF